MYNAKEAAAVVLHFFAGNESAFDYHWLDTNLRKRWGKRPVTYSLSAQNYTARRST